MTGLMKKKWLIIIYLITVSTLFAQRGWNYRDHGYGSDNPMAWFLLIVLIIYFISEEQKRAKPNDKRTIKSDKKPISQITNSKVSKNQKEQSKVTKKKEQKKSSFKNEKLYQLAKEYYSIFPNVTFISDEITKNNKFYNDKLKEPFHEWFKYRSRPQEKVDFTNLLNLNSPLKVGIGTVLGSNNLTVLDIDGFEDQRIVKSMCAFLFGNSEYEWIVQTGSGKGFHIFFYCSIPEKLTISNSVGERFSPKEGAKSNVEKIEWLWRTHVVLPPSLHSSGKVYRFNNKKIKIPKRKIKTIKKEDVEKCIEIFFPFEKEREILTTYFGLIRYDPNEGFIED